MALITPPLSRPSSIDEVTCASPASSSGASRAAEDDFHELVSDLSLALGSSSGRTIADVDPAKIVKRMEEYSSKEKEWSRYAFEDRSRAYTRNLVDAGNGKSNLLILVWTPGKGSPIHDHADAHCVMKVLKGRLEESRFDWPVSEDSKPLRLSNEKTLHAGQVAYMSDQLGLHCISNPDTSEIAVSLHLYTPPNAAKHGCDIFDRKTGRSSHVQQCHFDSEYGVIQ